MKLLYAVVRDVDSADVIKKLNKKGFYVTKLASTGGFLREGNTTLMIGTDDNKVDDVIGIIKDECGPRRQVYSHPIATSEFTPVNTVVNVGGATIFVVDVDRFVKI